MGSAAVQGRLWGMQARDFADQLEQVCLPLFGAALDAARVSPGARFLDDRSHTRPDGTIRYDNVFLWAAGERP